MFFALFVAVGLLALIPFGMQAVRDWRIAYVYQPAECEIIDHQLVESTTTFRWQGGGRTESRNSFPQFTFKYRVDGQMRLATGLDNHDGVMTSFEDWRYFTVGGKYPCWYDPASPDTAVLLRKTEWTFYLGALIPGLFILMGGHLMRRMLRSRRDAGLTAPGQGTRLRYRLTPVMSHRRLTGCLLIVILALAISLVGIWAAPWSNRTTQIFSPMFWLFAVVAAMEFFVTYHFIRAIRATGNAEPQVELSAEPLQPSQTAAINILQGGPLHVADYRVELVCVEVSSSTRTPVRQTVISIGALNLLDASEASARIFTADITIPSNARPSNRTVQSLRTWCIRVRRQVNDQTELVTDFPFRVIKPGANDSDES